MRHLLALILASALAAPAAHGASGAAGIDAPTLDLPEIDTLSIRAHLRVLAHDSLEGRGTGTRGERRAADYIVGQLEGLGIPGAMPGGGYRQPIPLTTVELDLAASELTIEATGEESSSEFSAGHHFIPAPGGSSAFRDFAGRAIFAGTAGLAREALADHPDLEGAVVVILGTLGREALNLVPDWVDRGVAGVISLLPDPGHLEAVGEGYGPTRYALTAEVDNPVWQSPLPNLIAGPEVARALLAGAPLASDALDGTKPFRALPLERRVDARIRTRSSELPAANIAALIEGSDPELRDEVVVYTAHYDHLGIGRPDARGDSIYNGFSDNAAGVAMLLAIAEKMRDAPPARSVLFLFFTGEERGLLGSSYYVTAPAVPLERVAAVINLDAGAPAAPPRNWKIAGGKLSTLGDMASAVAQRNGWIADHTDPSPNSDHWPFLRQGVPAIFIIPGQDWEGVTRLEKEALQHRWENYHQPADEWHPDFPLQGLKRYAELALQIGFEAGDAKERPRIR